MLAELVTAIMGDDFNSYYAGEDFLKALRVSREKKSLVWERCSRNWWIVSDDRPVYAMTNTPDHENWDEV